MLNYFKKKKKYTIHLNINKAASSFRSTGTRGAWHHVNQTVPWRWDWSKKRFINQPVNKELKNEKRNVGIGCD